MTKIKALINSNIKVNAITLAYASKQDLIIRHINVKAQKINGFILKMFEMVLIRFQIEDKLRKT